MTPEISQIVGRVREVLMIPPGPSLDRLLRAGELARMPSDLPPWVQEVWNMIQAPEEGK